MKKPILLFLLSLGFQSFGQTEVDSLRTAVTKTSGVAKARSMVALGDALGESDLAESIESLDSALVIFHREGDQAGWTEAMAMKVIVYAAGGHNYSAVRAFERIDTLIELIDTSGVYGPLLNSAALAYGNLGKVDKGIGLLYSLLGRARLLKDTMGQIEVLDNLTNDNFEGPDREKNLAIYDSIIALAAAYSQMVPGRLTEIYNNKASELLAMGLLDQAEESIKLALEEGKASKASRVTFLYCYFTSAEIAFARNDLAACQDYFRQCSELVDDLTSLSDRSVAMEARSHYYLIGGDRESSNFWFDRSLQLADSAGQFNQKEEMFTLRSRILKALGQYRDALFYFEAATNIRDSARTMRQRQQLEELKVVNETDLAESENRLLRQQNENILLSERRKTSFFMVVMGFVMLAGGILVFFLARTRRLNNSIVAQNEQLAAQNEQLKQLRDDNELLVGIVAHDLKAPLTKIESLLGLLLPRDEVSPDKLTLLDMTMGVIEGGRNLVEDILVLSEAGRSTAPQLAPSDLGHLVRKVSADFRDIAARKNIALELLPPPQPVMPYLHPPYMIRVLDNLISNGIKFSPRDGRIVIEWGEDQRGDWCTVKDFGPGIPEAERDQLFQRFSRTSNRPTAGESSTGLGLFIVKTLLDTMNATIEMDSEPGAGSTFTIRFSPPPSVEN